MSKKPAVIDAGASLATNGRKAPAVSDALQLPQTATYTLVDLNFKVPPEFRDRFKRHAFEERLKNVQLLVRALEAWERENLTPEKTKARGVITLNLANSANSRWRE
jgi:hypothetical protein